MDGRLTVKSEQGVGSSFKIKLRFPLPSELAGTSDAGGRQLPAAFEKRDVNPAGPKCENECSSRYGETQGQKRSDSNIDIAMSTGSSELVHRSVSPSKNKQFDLAERKSSISITQPPLNATSHKDPKPNGPVAIPVDGVAKPDPDQAEQTSDPLSTAQIEPQSTLHVLVAEDDRINSAIVRKRLEKLGHTVHLTMNGKECAAAYQDCPDSFDAVLMDIQVRSP